MPPKPAEPNRLQQSVAPNTLRGFDAPADSWLASGAIDGKRSRRGAPAPPRPKRAQRPAITPRLLGRIGLLLALAGLLPFLSAEPRWEEVGLGMMCLGVGIVLLAGSQRVLQSQAAALGRSRPSMLDLLLAAPQWAVLSLIGVGLVLAGLFLLVDAVAASG